MPLIEPKPTAGDKARAVRLMAAEAMADLPLADLCDMIEAEVARRTQHGLGPQDAARLTKTSHEIGGLAWRYLEASA